VTETVSYCDDIKLKTIDQNCLTDNYEVIANVIQQPNCLQCNIQKDGNKIAVEVEREFLVEVIGDTKVSVKVERERHHNHHKGPYDKPFKQEQVKRK